MCKVRCQHLLHYCDNISLYVPHYYFIYLYFLLSVNTIQTIFSLYYACGNITNNMQIGYYFVGKYNIINFKIDYYSYLSSDDIAKPFMQNKCTRTLRTEFRIFDEKYGGREQGLNFCAMYTLSWNRI